MKKTRMKVPIELITGFESNKYELAVAMMKYVERVEEMPELLMDYNESEKEKLAIIAIDKILTGDVKFSYGK